MIFNNKTVIITGGSEGVGAATARLFAEAGANLFLVARNKKNLDAIAEELRGKTQVEVFAMDVSDAGACVDLFKKAAFEFGQIDVLVNNAGYHARGPFEDISAEDIGRMVDVNLKAPAVLTRIALPYLREAGGGAVINVGSLAGRLPVPGLAGYGATKAGLKSLTHSLGMELEDSGIKFAVVSPGPIDTGFIMNDIDSVADVNFSQPMCTAEEVAQVILDLCGNNIREQCMHRSSAFLTTLNYVFPWVRPLMLPMLKRKGAKVKARLKAERKRSASDSPDR